MKSRSETLIDRLAETHSLTVDEYEELVAGQTGALAEYAAAYAIEARRKYYGDDVYIRGLIEVGNVCRNDCFYCGIRRSNHDCERYVLDRKQILASCAEGYDIGFRTFVIQGGEGSLSVDDICGTVAEIRRQYPDCAVTLSLGEYQREDYQRMFDAGADRYLLRHETADSEHYAKLHPAELSLENRMRCLRDLKDTGFQVGCGFMVGSPYQTAEK